MCALEGKRTREKAHAREKVRQRGGVEGVEEPVTERKRETDGGKEIRTSEIVSDGDRQRFACRMVKDAWLKFKWQNHRKHVDPGV